MTSSAITNNNQLSYPHFLEILSRCRRSLCRLKLWGICCVLRCLQFVEGNNYSVKACGEWKRLSNEAQIELEPVRKLHCLKSVSSNHKTILSSVALDFVVQGWSWVSAVGCCRLKVCHEERCLQHSNVLPPQWWGVREFFVFVIGLVLVCISCVCVSVCTCPGLFMSCVCVRVYVCVSEYMCV